MTKKFKNILYFLILVLFSVYLFLQFVIFSQGPEIKVYKYRENTVDSSIFLRGQALKAKKFFIAGQEVFLNTNYEFEREIFLFPGINKIKLQLQTKDDSFVEENIQIFRTKKS